MNNQYYDDNLLKLSEYYKDTTLLQLQNFIPDYSLPLLNLPSNELDINSIVHNIDHKVQRDWLYHTSFMQIVDIVSGLGTCERRKVGAVLVRNRRILATGFNGTPPGAPHCNDEICPGKNAPSGSSLSLCSAVHAEENCIVYCARYGVSAVDSVLYCSCEPCDDCMKLVETVGIKRVIFNEPYPTKMSALRKYFKAVCISLDDLKQEYTTFSMGRLTFN